MQDKEAEVSFLAKEFDLPPVRAASLVAADEDEALRLAAQQRDSQLEDDPLSGKPTPIPPETHRIPDDGGMQKSVHKRQNEAGRAGP